MKYFTNKWQNKVRDDCDSQYELIKVLPGEINLYYKCHNGELELSYPELYSYVLSDKSITRGFDDIIEKGFIKVNELGGRGKGDYNKYSVIDDWVDYGTEKFEPRKRIKSAKYGFCNNGLKN